MSNDKEYILGTDPEELQRLGFQHRVWSKEMFELWERCGLSPGHKILDLGCGPGFCSFDMAQIVGVSGRVDGVDISPQFIDYANRQAASRALSQCHFHCTSFDDMNFEPGSFDFIYCRWAMAWIENAEDIVKKAFAYLKAGGVFMAQEYLHWGDFRVEPETPEVRAVIEACRESWRIMPGNIDVGPLMVNTLNQLGAHVFHLDPLIKIVRPKDTAWHWPATFLKIYSEKLIAMKLLSSDQRDVFLKEWAQMEKQPDTVLYTPLMMSMAARKPH